MNDWLKELRSILTLRFPDAVFIEVFVNNECIEVKPTYKGELSGYSMKKVDGTWCSAREER